MIRIKLSLPSLIEIDLHVFVFFPWVTDLGDGPQMIKPTMELHVKDTQNLEPTKHSISTSSAELYSKLYRK